MGIQERTTVLFILSLLFFSVVNPAIYASETTSSQLFFEALPISLGTVERFSGQHTEQPDCFRLDVPGQGLLLLDVAQENGQSVEPRMGLLGSRKSSLRVLDSSAHHLLILTLAPQRLAACVGAQDPSRALGNYKVSSTFEAFSYAGSLDRSIDPIEIEPDGIRNLLGDLDLSIDPIEIEPDGIRNANFDRSIDPIEIEPDGIRNATFERSIDPMEIEPDGIRNANFDRSIDPIEIEPDGIRLHRLLASLCRSGKVDDHSDSLLCASPITSGQPVTGQLENDWGDDRDLFVFELEHRETVRVEATSDVGTWLTLYDRNGQALETKAADAQRSSHLYKTLAPGIYFLKVEARAWEHGSFALAIDAQPKPW